MSGVFISVKGMKEAQAKAIQMVKDIQGTPIVDAVKKATLLVTADAKRNAPVDTGRLRASITPEIRAGGGGELVEGVVGSNVEYAPYQELGTRRMKGKRYLQRAVEKNMNRIKTIFEKAAEEIAKA